MNNLSLIGQKAPDFTVPAVRANGEIENAYHFAQETVDKYALVFFYPLDFTFVCPSELIALDHRIDDFKARNIEVVSVSVDSQFTHHAYRNTPIDKGGIGHVRYTMAADVNHAICQSYGIEHAAGVALRGAFLIDKHGVIRAALINDLPIGRDVDEILRLFDAIQFHEEHGMVCPAGWKKGQKGMNASPKGVAEYLAENAEAL